MEREDVTAQDVIDAIRFIFEAQKDGIQRANLVDALLEFAPETDGDGGIQLTLLLLAEGSLRVELT